MVLFKKKNHRQNLNTDRKRLLLLSCISRVRLGPHRQQPTRLSRPWDSPGKNSGMGCHFLLQCMKVKSESEVAQSCPTCSDPMDCSLPGSSAHGIFQARVLEWGAIAFSERSCIVKAKIMHEISQVVAPHIQRGPVNRSNAGTWQCCSQDSS